MTLPVSRIRAAFESSPLQWKLACKGLQNDPETSNELPPTDCLVLWIFLLLQRLKFLTAEQRMLLYEQLAETVHRQPDSFPPAAREQALLVIGDGRYATWTCLTGWLDLQTGDRCSAVPAPVLESVAYNLTTLYSRNFHACSSRSETPHGSEPRRPPAAEKRIQR